MAMMRNLAYEIYTRNLKCKLTQSALWQSSQILLLLLLLLLMVIIMIIIIIIDD